MSSPQASTSAPTAFSAYASKFLTSSRSGGNDSNEVRIWHLVNIELTSRSSVLHPLDHLHTTPFYHHRLLLNQDW